MDTAARNQHLLSLSDLQAWSGYDRPADIRRMLDAAGIWYLEGRNGVPITTLDAISKAAIVKKSQPLEFTDG